MLLLIVGQIIGSLFLSRPLQRIFSYNQFLVVTQVLFLLVPVLLYLLVTGLPIKQTLRLNKLSIVDIMIIIAIALVSQPIAAFFAQLSNIFFEDTISQVVKEIQSISYLKQLGIIALTPAICEEVTMRGVILSGYNKLSTRKAALATGLFFGILHMNPQQFLYAFVLGIIFAYLVRITNSLFSTIICHFTFNGFQITMAYLATKLNPDMLDETRDIKNISINSQLIALSVYFIIAIAAAYIIMKLIKYMENRHTNIILRHSNSGSVKQELNPEANYEYQEYEQKGEKIINGPFIGVILVYLLIMLLL
jgi:membrane protease YdiL (CAAX protease family)